MMGRATALPCKCRFTALPLTDMALGDIWLAGPNGDCSNMGDCSKGPCGDGENLLGDCPIWEHTATYPIAYTPGGSVTVGGVPINPGQTVRFLRGDLTPERPYTYPVEVFRAPTAEPPPIEAGEYKPSPGAYPRLHIHSMTPPSASYYVADIELDAGAGSILNWNADGELVQGFEGPVWFSPDGNGNMTFVGPAQGSLVPGTKFGLDGVVVGPVPSGLIKWKVEAFPLPQGTLLPTTPYESIPEEAAAGEYMLEWGKTTFRDAITLIANPAEAFSGSVSVTLRSACENPAP